MEKTYKVVTVKHPNCGVPYTFEVPKNLVLNVGDYVLCKTKTSQFPQVAQCITPSFEILGYQLVKLYEIVPKNLKPVVGVLTPVMYAFTEEKEDDKDGQQDGWEPF